MILVCPECGTENNIPDPLLPYRRYYCNSRRCNKEFENIPGISNVDREDEPLLIGKDVSWEDVEGEMLKVKRFTPFGTVEGDKIKAPPIPMPYAALAIESTNWSRELSLPVVHKVDFRNLWECFQVRGVNPDEEVLVGYHKAPRRRFAKIFSSFLPRLGIFIFPQGHLEEAEDPNFRPKDIGAWYTPIAKWKPE